MIKEGLARDQIGWWQVNQLVLYRIDLLEFGWFL